jgi:hypothetical protein
MTNQQSSKTTQGCLKKAKIAPINDAPKNLLNLQFGNLQGNQLPDQMETIYANLLKRAQDSSNQGQFAQAIATVAGIPKNSQHYPMAQRLQEDWAQELLQQATQEWHQANMVKAIALLNTIPSTSQLSDRLPEIRQRWHQQAKQLNQAIAAQKAQNWQGVMTALQPLESTPLQNSPLVQELLQQAMTQPYEPDGTLLQIATEGMPTTLQPSIENWQ